MQKKKILLQHSVLDYKIDLYFPKHKLAIEVDEKVHSDRDDEKENEREKKRKVAVNLLEPIPIERL